MDDVTQANTLSTGGQNRSDHLQSTADTLKRERRGSQIDPDIDYMHIASDAHPPDLHRAPSKLHYEKYSEVTISKYGHKTARPVPAEEHRRQVGTADSR